MTVLQTNSHITYIGDGNQTEFDYNFKIYQDDNLKVYLNGVLQGQVADYVMTNSGDETGGAVTFLVAPPANSQVDLERVLEYQQLLDLIPYDKFPAESVESALDYLCMLTQQNAFANARALTAAASIPDTVDLTIQPPGAGMFWKWTDDGLAIEYADITELGEQIIASATDQEIIDGTETDIRLVSPANIKLGVDTHQDPPLTAVQDVDYIEIVDVLPGTPDITKLYLVRE